MKKSVGFLAVALAVLMVPLGDANAASKKRTDPRLVATSVGVGAASAAGYFALRDWHWGRHPVRYHGLTRAGAWAGTTVACMAISPMVGTAMVRRPLTYREAHVLMGGCLVPIIGGWLVNAAYDANPHWERFDAPRRRR